MSDRVYAATRKGLFELERGVSGRWEMGQVSFLGDPVSVVLDDPRDGALYAALNLGHFGVKLHRSEDRGRTWTECRAPAFPVAPEGETDAAPSVHQVWALAVGGPAPEHGLWAGTIPAALFHSTDRGDSWQLNESLWAVPERAHWFGGGYDEAGLHSICVHPRRPEQVAVAVSCGGVWMTPDGGANWNCRADGMFAEYAPPEHRDNPAIQDPHRMVQCAATPDALWVQHHNGVFRSTDGARLWTHVPAAQPSGFGFAVAVHPRDPQTAWFVPGVKDECRVPVDGNLVVSRTRDGGATFEVLTDGLPQQHAYDLVYRHGLDVDAGGERLVMGSTTGSLWISENGGDRWQQITGHLPPVYQVLFVN